MGQLERREALEGDVNTETEIQRKPAEERKAILARQIAMLVAQKRRVESQSDYQAILARRSLGREKREMVTVDEWGTPSIQPL
jgi:hypothetical protein